MALDRKTGKEVWRAGGINESWATPILVPVEGGRDTAENIPGAELCIVAGMGHDFPSQLFGEIADGIMRAVERSKASA